MTGVREFWTNLIELLTTAFIQPQELSVVISHHKKPDLSALVLLGLISFCNSVAVYQLRTSYDKGFWFFLPLVFIIGLVFLVLVSIIAGSLIDALVSYFFHEKHVSSLVTIRLVAIGFLPYLFLLPVSVPSGFFSFQFIVMGFMYVLLMLWSFGIMVNSIRYLYELPTGKTVLVVLVAMVLLYSFPFIYMLFGTIELGMAYRDIVQGHGALAEVAPFNRLVVGRLPSLGIELVLASADASAPSDDAVVIGVGARAADGVSITGPARPGMTRAQVEAELGAAPETVEEFAFYPAGVSVEYGSDDAVKRVGVYAAYDLAPTPPPMQPAPE